MVIWLLGHDSRNCCIMYIYALSDSHNPQMFLALGAAYGTAKSGTGIAAMSVMRPELIMKSVVPVVMAGIVAIYGVVIAVLISQRMAWNMSLFA